MKNAYHKMMFKVFRFLERRFHKMGSWCNGVSLRNQVKIVRTQEEIAASIKMMHDILNSNKED